MATTIIVMDIGMVTETTFGRTAISGVTGITSVIVITGLTGIDIPITGADGEAIALVILRFREKFG